MEMIDPVTATRRRTVGRRKRPPLHLTRKRFSCALFSVLFSRLISLFSFSSPPPLFCFSLFSFPDRKDTKVDTQVVFLGDEDKFRLLGSGGQPVAGERQSGGIQSAHTGVLTRQVDTGHRLSQRCRMDKVGAIIPVGIIPRDSREKMENMTSLRPDMSLTSRF